MLAGVQQDIIDGAAVVSRVRDEVRVALDDFHAYWYLGKRFQYSPFIQYVQAPFQSATLNFNSMGFRGPEFVPGRTAGVRLAFFGASAVLGVPNATDGQTIPELCRAELARHSRQVELLRAQGGPPIALTAFRRVREGKQRMEVRFDGVAGCLRTPRGGSAKQIVLAIVDGELRMRWMTPRECA